MRLAGGEGVCSPSARPALVGLTKGTGSPEAGAVVSGAATALAAGGAGWLPVMGWSAADPLQPPNSAAAKANSPMARFFFMEQWCKSVII